MHNEFELKSQQLTAGHKTFGCQWFFGHSTPLQLLFSGDKNVARSPKRFIPPKR